MRLVERTQAFSKLGEALRNVSLNDWKSLAEKARNENPWFTESNIMLALQGAAILLEKNKLSLWIERYSPEPSAMKTVGVIMAGNIPLVGLHDVIVVLLAGHRLKQKLSSKDSVLMKYVQKKLIDIEPGFSERIITDENLKEVDALIATGSDNTARYFEYYFRKIPHVIRKNRASCAVIEGDEPAKELEDLGRDVFSHFGLGCRNISKLFVPDDFELARLLKSWESFAGVMDHHKYANNYDYQKSVLLVNLETHLDSGFVLLKESRELVSPIAMLFYERYRDLSEVREKIAQHNEKLQVIASAGGWFEKSVPFGKAQMPEIDDYADRVDTMRFLMEMK